MPTIAGNICIVRSRNHVEAEIYLFQLPNIYAPNISRSISNQNRYLFINKTFLKRIKLKIVFFDRIPKQ